MADIPIILTTAGRTNTAPAVLRDEVVALVSAIVPGFTSNLPGSLIEDLVSTETGALIVLDQLITELINSVTPYGANAFILNQQGQMFGVQPGASVNTSVYIVFGGVPGFVIAQGFTVSDGQHQYVVQEGGVIQASGFSLPIFAVATVSGTWAVPVNTVNQLITSAPTSFTLTVYNPQAGVPSIGAETEEGYRARVLQAAVASAQGFPAFLRTLLGNVPGVQSRLISIKQGSPGWEIIVGGGDPYNVANAIFRAVFDISILRGSVTGVTGITKANPGVVTTDINHGLTTGQNDVSIAAVLGMTAANGGPYTVTVISPTTFSFGVNTTSFGTYTGGGVVTPNTRNVTVTLVDFPDSYVVPFINPPQQSVAMTLTWNTSSINVVSPAAVAQLGNPALVAYVNSVAVGQPMNLFELQATFQQAIASVIPPALLTRMVFSVSIDGIGVAPDAGTGIIAGDPESYFQTDTSLITINQG